MGQKVNLHNVRLSFPNLFKPTAFNQDQDPKYSATFILQADDPQAARLREVMLEQATARWGKKIPASVKMLLRDGSEKDYAGFGAGTVFFTASNATRPLVLGRKLEPLTAGDGIPYAGCYVNASIDVYAHEHPKGGKMVIASLGGVQFFKDGEAFGGGRPASVSDFVEYEDEDNDDFLGNAA